MTEWYVIFLAHQPEEMFSPRLGTIWRAARRRRDSSARTIPPFPIAEHRRSRIQEWSHLVSKSLIYVRVKRSYGRNKARNKRNECRWEFCWRDAVWIFMKAVLNSRLTSFYLKKQQSRSICLSCTDIIVLLILLLAKMSIHSYVAKIVLSSSSS